MNFSVSHQDIPAVEAGLLALPCFDGEPGFGPAFAAIDERLGGLLTQVAREEQFQGKAGQTMTFAEASAMKLYSAQAATEVALEAVQLHGGNGYMAEYQVEQLARDAKVLQIYAGTDEIQITHIAKDLLRR